MPASSVSVLTSSTQLWAGTGLSGSTGAYVSNTSANKIWLTFGGAAAVLDTGLLIPAGEQVYIRKEFASQACFGIAETAASTCGIERIVP